MTTTTIEAPPRLSAGLCYLLRTLTRGAPRDGVLCLVSHSGRASGSAGAYVPVADVAEVDVLPAAVLSLLERSAAPWSMGIATRESASHGAPVCTVSAIVAGVAHDRVCQNPDDPDRPHGRRWIWDEAAIDASIARLRAWLPPSCIVDARRVIVGVWALDRPVSVRRASERHDYLGLLHRVAAHLEATAIGQDITIEQLAVPVPGTTIPNATGGAPERVTIRSIDASAIYALQDIEERLS